MNAVEAAVSAARRKSPLRTAAATTSDQFSDGFQVGILFRDVAKGWVHFETSEQMDLRRFRISEKSVVATHIIIVNRLAQQPDRSFEQKFFRLKGFAELVQTKTGVEIAGGATRRDATKFATDA